MASDIGLQALCVAAMLQAAKQLYTLGQEGHWTESEVTPLIKAISVTDPITAYDVYNKNDLYAGFKILSTIFSKSASNDKEIILHAFRYAKVGMNLERAITKKNIVSETFFKRLDKIIEYADENLLDELNDEYHQRLADFYNNLISKPGIFLFMILGKKEYLTRPEVQRKVRVMIICIFRAVVLWRQVGGRRRSFFLRASKLSNYAQDFLFNR
jgi:high frequency lysogenization protein